MPPNMEEYMNSLLSAVLPSVLNKFRIYLTLLRFLDYNISDDITKVCLSHSKKSWAEFWGSPDVT